MFKTQRVEPKKDLLALLSSDKKEKSILNALLNTLKIDPSLIQKEYILKRHLFHIIVLKDLAVVMKGMLDSIYKPLAFQADRKKETVIHYAVRKFESSTKMLDLLLEYLPSLIDIPNKRGQTALHLAVSDGKVAAIKTLIRHNADPDRKDESSKTSRDYAVDQPKLIEALISINLNNLHFNQQFPVLDGEHTSREAVVQLTERFSMLRLASESDDSWDDISYLSSESSRTQSDGIQTPSSSKNSDRSDDLSSPTLLAGASNSSEKSAEDTQEEIVFTLADLREGHVDKLRRYLISGGDPDKNIFLSRPLIIQAFILAASSEHSENASALTEQFYLLLEYGLLENQNSKINFKALVRDRPNCLPILQGGMNHLSWQLRAQALAHRHQLSIYGSHLDRILYRNGLGLRIPDIFRELDYHELSEIYGIKEEIVEVFDLLCACKANKQAARVFDKTLISITAQGILNTLSPIEILDCLIKLFPHFDVQQRLTACMIVKELMRDDIFNIMVCSDEFFFAIKKFTNTVRDVFADGDEIAEKLLQIFDEKKNIFYHRAASNYRCLQECISIPGLSEKLISVQMIIKNGIESEGAEQEKWLKFFANEIRKITIHFYQDLRVSEFYNLAWKKNQSNEAYSSINKEIQLYNMLSNFIVDEILVCPPIDIPRALSFFILVARELCCSADTTGPDMNGLSKIVGALLKNPISRMNSMLSQLPCEINSILRQIQILSGAESNYKWQREVTNNFQTTFMFTGMITKDIVMCFEGNETNPLALAETLGAIFRKILEIQSQLHYKPVFFKTDLIQHLLKNYANIDEDDIATKQYAASCRAVAPASEMPLDLDEIDNLVKLFNILSEFTKTETIPHEICFKKKIFTIGSMIQPLLELFTELNAKEASFIEQKHNAKKMHTHLEDLFALTKDKYFITQNPLVFTRLYSQHRSQPALNVSFETVAIERRERERINFK
ncbi:RasGEF domain-containing protein [Candidatus Berkiella cookevillensis]|nr:RasGEF domain-containing protein [Candidatus Berkiella cookevillensis]